MRTSVRSVAASPSNGSRWTKSEITGATCQTGSSNRPSITGALDARAADAVGAVLAVFESTCAASAPGQHSATEHKVRANVRNLRTSAAPVIAAPTVWERAKPAASAARAASARPAA
jgi:hypothetical protein